MTEDIQTQEHDVPAQTGETRVTEEQVRQALTQVYDP